MLDLDRGQKATGAIPVAGARTTESVLIDKVKLEFLVVFELRRSTLLQ